jgi:ABC-type multidrug transport system fused ATPase/permease subunit
VQLLFSNSGTVRSNLDPEGEFTDDDMWAALDKLDLRQTVAAAAAGGLDAEVTENGDNLPVGRRQELALARAVLRGPPPVVLLDEATSGLEPAKEAAAHKTLLKALSGSTVIAVAHRLPPTLHYDRVIVVGEGGRILEDGAPRHLLRKPMGFFSALWRAAGGGGGGVAASSQSLQD